MPSYSGTGYLGTTAGSACYLILNVWENWTSTEGNYSNCGANLILRIGPSWWAASRGSWSVSGSASGSGSWDSTTTFYQGDTTLWSGTFNIGHNANGDASVSLNANFNSSYELNGSTSAGGALSHINRYFTRTPNINKNSSTTTSIEIKWNTSENCNSIKCYVDGVLNQTLNVSGTTGTFIIAELGSNTNHSIYISCKRADSGLWSNSNTLNEATSNKTGHIRIGGIEKEATPYIRINNEWKVAVPHIRKSNTWERSK